MFASECSHEIRWIQTPVPGTCCFPSSPLISPSLTHTAQSIIRLSASLRTYHTRTTNLLHTSLTPLTPPTRVFNTSHSTSHTTRPTHFPHSSNPRPTTCYTLDAPHMSRTRPTYFPCTPDTHCTHPHPLRTKHFPHTSHTCDTRPPHFSRASQTSHTSLTLPSYFPHTSHSPLTHLPHLLHTLHTPHPRPQGCTVPSLLLPTIVPWVASTNCILVPEISGTNFIPSTNLTYSERSYLDADNDKAGVTVMVTGSCCQICAENSNTQEKI